MNISSQFPPKGIPRRIVNRAVTTVTLSALLVGGLFSFFYISIFRAPEPHNLPIAVVSADPTTLQTAGGNYLFHEVPDSSVGLAYLARHEVYAMIAVDESKQIVELSYASVDGSAVLESVKPVAQEISLHSNMPLEITNITPAVANNASPGRSVFFAVFGTALTGFVLSQALASVAKRLALTLHTRLSIMTGTSLASGLVTSIMLDPWFHIVPGIFWHAWPMVTLLSMSAVGTGAALLDFIGPMGQVITSVLFITLGNATATGMAPLPFLTHGYQVVSMLLPTGNVVRAIIGQEYFQGNGLCAGYLVPTIWVLISVTALIVLDKHPTSTGSH